MKRRRFESNTRDELENTRRQTGHIQVDSMIKPWNRVTSVSKSHRQRRYCRKWWEWRLMCREL